MHKLSESIRSFVKMQDPMDYNVFSTYFLCQNAQFVIEQRLTETY